ncbi:MAG: EAL domain-containing protein, partial [Planctomycetota bacterium]|nr:EAL domain-containing protein [Planctomycetota bacterium]
MTRFTDSVGAMLLLDELDVAVIIIARDDESIRYANRRVCKDLGLGRKEIQGRCYRNVFWPEFLPVFDRLLARCELGGKHKTIYYWAEMMMWEQISARLIVWNGAPSILINIANISDVARSEFKFENIAYFDNLLKLPNGAKLEEDINELASLETVALLYFEIERFDDINNLYGWDNGDALLKQIRDWMLYSETRRSRLYRVNNGFALLGRKVTLDDACDRAREIKRRFAKSWTLTAGGNSLQLYCTINLGVVYGKYVKNEMRNLLLRTIRTRRNAKVGYSVYDERADQEAKRVLILRDRLINSIFNDMKGFDIHYQPIVSAGARQWVAIEALCRWRDADGNNVPPLEFIPVAEQLGLVDHIDRWVRNSAMRLCAELGLVKRGFMLDVNFSPTQKI